MSKTPVSIARIISGGQTGADRAALDEAISRGISYGGTVPKGGWAEDFAGRPPGVLAHYPRLTESHTSDLRHRTQANIENSHATWIVNVKGSPGTQWTWDHAQRAMRPVIVTSNAAKALAWLQQVSFLHSGVPLVLNVAGPRASEDPSVYNRVRAELGTVLESLGYPRLR